MTLIVVSSNVKWVDEPKVRAINDAACAAGPVLRSCLTTSERGCG
jgi:hypothetical protein